MLSYPSGLSVGCGCAVVQQSGRGVMMESGYINTAHISSILRAGLSPHPGKGSLNRQALCLLGRVFSHGLACSLSLPSPGYIASGGDKRRQRLVEAATVAKLLLSGSQNRLGIKRRTAKITMRCFYISIREKEVSTPQLSPPLIQGKDQRIDNSIKFMFIERVPRGSLQPIPEWIQS